MNISKLFVDCSCTALSIVGFYTPQFVSMVLLLFSVVVFVYRSAFVWVEMISCFYFIFFSSRRAWRRQGVTGASYLSFETRQLRLLL